MRCFFCCLMTTVFIMGSSQVLFATAKNIPTQSAQWLASAGTRVAETEDGDTVFLNPAGSTEMADGLHFHISAMNPVDNTTYTDESTGKKYLRMTDSIYTPFAFTYKSDDYATFFTFSIPGATGGGEFDDNGIYIFDMMADIYSGTQSEEVVATNRSFKYSAGLGAFTLGGAMKFGDTLSLAYGIRQVFYQYAADGGADMVVVSSGENIGRFGMDAEASGSGIGHVIGINIKFSDNFNVAMRYDTEVPIRTETTVGAADTTGAVNGEKKDDNLPATAQLGIALQLTDSLKLDIAYGIYFQKGVKMEPGTEYTDKYNDEFAIGAGLKYTMGDLLTLRTGLRYSSGDPDEALTFTYMNSKTSYTGIGLGVDLNLTSDITILLAHIQYNFAMGRSLADPYGTFKIDEQTYQSALGLEMRF